MNNLEFMRRQRNLTQRELGKLSTVAASYICNAEKRGLILFEGQAQRIADVLGWTGDPMELFEEVKDDNYCTNATE